MEVLRYPNPILRQVAKPVEVFDKDLADFCNEMIDTMRAERGIGLAAPQVGKSIRLVVMQIEEGKPFVLVNPVLLKHEGERSFEEGCLSFPGQFSKLKSAEIVLVEYQDYLGNKITRTFEGLEATVIQHEIDHLNGILMIDRMAKKEMIKVKTKFLKGPR